MIKIGTNLLYKGPLFLDSRHGIATTKTDLLEWNIPVPEGFEVYLNLDNDPGWYTYSSKNNEPETGKFKRRLDAGYVDSVAANLLARITLINSQIQGINTEIQNLWDAINSIPQPTSIELVINYSNAGQRETGNPITPHFEWTLTNFGNAISPSDYTVKLNGQTIENTGSWTAPGDIYQSTTYILTATYDSKNYTKTQEYTFVSRWYKYFGVSSLTTLSSINDLENMQTLSGTGTPSVFFEGVADCSGGKYPYYVFPASIYNSSGFVVFCGGIRTTDIVVRDLGDYKTVRLGGIQTGQIQMKYEQYNS